MKLARIVVIAMMSALTFAQGAKAVEKGQSSETSSSVTFDAVTKATTTDVADFKANPKSLLNSNPIGGLQLVAMVKSLALTDPSTVASLIDLIGTANPVQLAAIGSGLGQAAKILKNSSNDGDRKAAETIASLVEGARNNSLQSSFKNSLTGTATPGSKTSNGTGSSGSSAFVAGGGVGGVVNNGGNGGGSRNTSTANTPPASTTSTVNTTETIQFSGASVTCTSSVSPTKSC